ncbi:hypothetical protein [Cyclobacterium plantarum]|uniref:YCII-related domain-containing protein n=1 Tax=Cyclobacterium plantarum TaxID=2716263 RepID=A0ABX0HE72_9BACT|nr:hypothetical protein [Cyclobacterium plantarum]NHE58639.1 hypothetical protein [Cyclobacterium plantarum]
MKKYLAIYFGGATESEKSTPMNENLQQEFMDAWAKWAENHKDSVVDFGRPLGRAKSVNQTGVTDKENKMIAYSIVHAESHEQAASMFIEHPHLNLHSDNSIEIIKMRHMPEID